MGFLFPKQQTAMFSPLTLLSIPCSLLFKFINCVKCTRVRICVCAYNVPVRKNVAPYKYFIIIIILWDYWRTVCYEQCCFEAWRVQCSMFISFWYPPPPLALIYNHNGWHKTPSYLCTYLHPHSWWSVEPTAAPWWAICWGHSPRKSMSVQWHG